MRFFNPETLTEVIPGIHSTEGAVELPDDNWFFVLESIPEGKKLAANEAGEPILVDIPPPTQEELTANAEALKLSLKATADDEIAWRQDAIDAGIATDEETAALAEWKKYRVLLMRVDTAKPVWPTPPGEQAS
ncbi:TPA: tail fiber assembly protein [Citrobacter farmeri]|nr:tail fiber assembly protein [Citrobacter farmeri]